MGNLPQETLDSLKQFDTCTIANAIEEFGVRLRNEGFTRPGLPCVNDDSAQLLGYAATCRVRSADPPVNGGAYMDRTDWWDLIAGLPLPRIAVIQDLDGETSGGSTVGEVHAAILKAFGCAGVITNGAVRDLPAIRSMKFPVFASSVAVSHSYLHIVDYCTRVDIFGLEIHSGDLLLADCHGVISIPLEIAAEIPKVAAKIRADEQRVIAICQAPDFSAQKLRDAFQKAR
jgi:regulator of RNase E activity RraA